MLMMTCIRQARYMVLNLLRFLMADQLLDKGLKATIFFAGSPRLPIIKTCFMNPLHQIAVLFHYTIFEIISNATCVLKGFYSTFVLHKIKSPHWKIILMKLLSLLVDSIQN